MTGEVRVRAPEEDMELKIFPVRTNNVTSKLASSSTIPTAAGREGITRTLCSRVMTEHGCPKGERPPRLSRKMFNLWQYKPHFQGMPTAKNQ
eukprot:7297414-Prorocentrum_lima.AAC.1